MNGRTARERSSRKVVPNPALMLHWRKLCGTKNEAEAAPPVGMTVATSESTLVPAS